MLAENEFSIEEEEVDEETEEKVRELYFIVLFTTVYGKSSIVLKNLFQLITVFRRTIFHPQVNL
jgi:hypothetical protein